jgi:DNA replication protein DnaC
VVVYDQPPRAESLLPPRVLAAVLDEQGEPVWGFRRYCGCPEGQAALERSRQARERFLERRAREQLAQRLRAIWETAAIPGAARHWTFESYLEHVQALHERRLVSSRDLRRAETAVLFLREDWLPSLDWLVLWGPPGGGKTGLAIAALRALVERDQCTALYVTVPELLDRLKATFDRVRGSEEARFDEVLESLARVEVLLLDDVGVEQRTPFNQEQLFKILNRRLLEHAENSRRRTILTTNLAVPQELAQHLDPRNMSRLRGASASYELALVDLRQRLPARGERG